MQNEIRQDKIVGSRRFSNYFWSFFLFVGGLGFLLAGMSSYFKINLLPFANPTELSFYSSRFSNDVLWNFKFRI
jgi:hypothetical protein